MRPAGLRHRAMRSARGSQCSGSPRVGPQLAPRRARDPPRHLRGCRPCRSSTFEDLQAAFDEECGITSVREVEIVVDVLTNPNR